MKPRPLFPRKSASKGRLESPVQAGIIAYLSIRNDCWFWRANTGGAKFDKYYVQFGLKGAADLQGVQSILSPWVAGYQQVMIGRFFAIESKREKGGKWSDDQKRWGANVVAHGGIYVVANSVELVQQALGPEQVRIQKIPMRNRIYPP